MAYYLGNTPTGCLEVFRSKTKPTHESTDGRFKSCRGPMSEGAAHYLKFREENDYPPLPPGLTAPELETLAAEDQDFYWQALWVVLTIPAEELAQYQEDEALEYNPDFAPVI
jgi:hypothetical protein